LPSTVALQAQMAKRRRLSNFTIDPECKYRPFSQRLVPGPNGLTQKAKLGPATIGCRYI
jgi:hypothetical protein